MLIVVRCTVLVLLLFGTLFFGFLPICIKPYLNSCQCEVFHRKTCETRKQRLAVCFLMLFGGGVLLSTCLVRLMHEVHLEFEEILNKCIELDTSAENLESFDLSEYKLLSGLQEDNGFVVEDNATEAVNLTKSKTSSHTDLHRKKHQQMIEDGDILCNNVNASFPLQEFITACGFFLIYFIVESIKLLIKYCQFIRSFDLKEDESDDALNDSPVLQNIRNLDKAVEISKICLSTRQSNCLCEVQNSFDRSPSPPGKHSTPQRKPSRRRFVKDLNLFYGEGDAKEQSNIEGIDDFMTVLALSFNSIFEGFATAFQHSQFSTWMLFVAIALHKFVSVFVISLETLNNDGSKVKVVLYVLIFSLMSPVGMLAAILTHSNLVEHSLNVAALNAISVGTLLYVALYEMLKQRKGFVEISGFTQFLVLLFGFVSMSVIEYFYIQVK